VISLAHRLKPVVALALLAGVLAGCTKIADNLYGPRLGDRVARNWEFLEDTYVQAGYIVPQRVPDQDSHQPHLSVAPHPLEAHKIEVLNFAADADTRELERADVASALEQWLDAAYVAAATEAPDVPEIQLIIRDVRVTQEEFPLPSLVEGDLYRYAAAVEIRLRYGDAPWDSYGTATFENHYTIYDTFAEGVGSRQINRMILQGMEETEREVRRMLLQAGLLRLVGRSNDIGPGRGY